MKIRDNLGTPSKEAHYHPVRWWLTKPGLSWRFLATLLERATERRAKQKR